MGKKAPDTPDVVGAATVEGLYSRETARDQSYAQNADQFNALGSSQWSQQLVTDPATGEKVTKWVNNQTLSPEMQFQFDNENRINTDLGTVANDMSSRVSGEMGAPLDWEQFGDVENLEQSADNAYARSTQRLDPRFAKEQATMETQMANRGLRAGDSAYDSAMSNFNTGKNDAYEMARLGATQEGRGYNTQANALRSQKIQEYLGKRGQSLKEQNAVRASQTTGDTISNFGSGGSA